MHDGMAVPDLTFPGVHYGPDETPWDLRVLLYAGGASAHTRLVSELIAEGKLGELQLDRLELVVGLHAEVAASLAGGNSRDNAKNNVQLLRRFFAFADRTARSLTVHDVTDTYCAWSDWLHRRTRSSSRRADGLNAPLTMRTAWSYAAQVGTLLDRMLARSTSIVELTRLYWRPQRKTAGGAQAEKQILADTFKFGHLLQDVCDGLNLNVMLEGEFPIRIALRDGKELVWERGPIASEFCDIEQSTLSQRYALANVRIEAEMLMFIAQTGINVAQAITLKLYHFFYVSHLDGYHVKDYKNRRGGAVLFEIFKDYKPHFERYLEWRRSLFETSPLLFPFIGRRGSRQEVRFANERVRRLCWQLDTPYIAPRTLRNIRVNWLLRQSADLDLTAEFAQHTKATLLSVYDRPSLQRATVEVARFWSKVDPSQIRTQSVAPGGCSGAPSELADKPPEAPRPDCVKPAGCLWCESHRDVDSLDHLWALTSFMHLKILELSRARLPLSELEVPPAQLAIDRIQSKLRWYEESSELRREWVQEATTLIAEGAYHPDFCVEIDVLEGG